jgi:hypothetical protein
METIMTQPGNAELAHLLNELAAEATAFDNKVDHYWHGEGIDQLEIFIDPDLYQYIRRWYDESRAFARRVADLKGVAATLDA